VEALIESIGASQVLFGWTTHIPRARLPVDLRHSWRTGATKKFAWSCGKTPTAVLVLSDSGRVNHRTRRAWGRVHRSGGEVGELPGPTTDSTTRLFDVRPSSRAQWFPGLRARRRASTFNELTPEKRRKPGVAPLRRAGSDYSLAETMVEGFPAWGNRTYQQQLVVTAIHPPMTSRHLTRNSSVRPNERPRGARSLSYNMGRRSMSPPCRRGRHVLQRLPGPDIARTWGTTKLGAETMGPHRHPGCVVDVSDRWWQEAIPTPMRLRRPEALLRSNYRITWRTWRPLGWEGVESRSGLAMWSCSDRMARAHRSDPERYVADGPPDPSCENAAIWPPTAGSG